MLCQKCNCDKPITEFQFRPHSKTYRKACTECESAARLTRKMTYKYRDRRAEASQYAKRVRHDPNKRAYIIWRDCKKSDIHHDRKNNLTIEFIQAIITSGCAYCGDIVGKITLDRIDNDLGHLRENVNAACLRCNYFRRDMPYAAWLHIVPKIKEAYELGLFLDWNGWSRKKVAESEGIEPSSPMCEPRFSGPFGEPTPALSE